MVPHDNAPPIGEPERTEQWADDILKPRQALVVGHD
jgi:hypothetical protein